ncbi:MAG: transcription termination factor NusA [Thermodesulfobacteriota bacterium]|jgi:N utilization substance protein A|nr:transcription termination/antitermination protein NusA [Deltaproteobacteria bacterium]
MLTELDRILDEVKRDKDLDKEVLIRTLEAALLKAAKNRYGYNVDIEAHFNPEIGEVELFQFKIVVNEIKNPKIEISLEDSKKLDPDAQVGDSLGSKIDMADFGRIAAQTAKQVIIQNIREAERENIYQNYKDRKGELINGIVQRFDKGNIIVNIGKAEAMLPVQEQVPRERYRQRDRIKGYILDIKKTTKDPQIILSRTHTGFIAELFKIEVPEISEGIITIKRVSREPGIRTKIAVESSASDVDPVGACVGAKGSRVQNIVQELKGEKIDIIPWSDDPAKFVCNALAPADIAEVIIDKEHTAMEVIVPDDQTSLAIGKKGQNVRLAVKLTGWKIDIKSKSEAEGDFEKSFQQLTQIPGIGETTAKTLFNEGYFTAIDIAKTKVEELIKLPGLGEKKAQMIKQAAGDFIQQQALNDTPPPSSNKKG